MPTLIIGLLYNLATFPGILVSGAFQSLFEEYYNVPLVDISSLDKEQVEEAADSEAFDDEEIDELMDIAEEGEDGVEQRYVDYSAISSYKKLVGLILSPFVASTLTALFLYSLVVLLLTWETLPFWIVGWVAFSVAGQAFPNRRPTNALFRRTREDDGLLRFAVFPIVIVAKLLSLLRILWVDAIYALILWFAVTAVLGMPAGA